MVDRKTMDSISDLFNEVITLTKENMVDPSSINRFKLVMSEKKLEIALKENNLNIQTFFAAYKQF